MVVPIPMTLFTLVTSLIGILHSIYYMKSLLNGVNPYEDPVSQTNIIVLVYLKLLFWNTQLSNIWPRNGFSLCVKSATFSTWSSLVNEDINL